MKIALRELEAVSDRLTFYSKGTALDVAPRPLFQLRKSQLFRSLPEIASTDTDIFERANLCNRLERGTPTVPQTGLRRVCRRSSRYFYDLNEYLKFFPAHLRIDYLFGDIIHAADRPTLVKSRPITPDNANSVLLNLDKLRHFKLSRDDRRWNEKIGRAVWRGGLHGPMRPALVRRHANNPKADIGHTRTLFEGISPKPFMSRHDQMAHRYIVSVEGNDVATNLKWIMASESVCLMPRPRFETWFLESRLQPGVHYVELADDFSDLDEKVAELEANPERARRIVASANAYVRQMVDKDLERIVSLLVLQKYFEATGQLPPSDLTGRFFNHG